MSSAHRERSLGSWKARLRAAGDALGVTVHACGRSGCRRVAFAHRRMRRDGIFLEERWLCSAACVEVMLLERLAELGRPAAPTPMHLPRMPFRLRLLQAGAITEAELARAQALAEGAGIPLVPAVRELRTVGDDKIAAALAAESGCAFFDLPPLAVPAALRIPEAIARHCEARTVGCTAERLVVGFASRLDRGLLAGLERMTGLKTEGCFFTPARCSAQREADSGFPSPASDPAEVPMAAKAVVAELLRTSAATGTERIALVAVRRLIWARLYQGGGRCEDRVFAAAEASPHLGVPAGERNEKKLRVL